MVSRFALGHQWLEDALNDFVPEEHYDEFGVMVLALSFFSSRRLAEPLSQGARSRPLAQ